MTKIILSKRIKELRTKKGLSQDQLADISGLSLRTVQRVESGQHISSGDTLSRLAATLEVNIEEIIELQNIEKRNDIQLFNKVNIFFDDWKKPVFYYLLFSCILFISLLFQSTKLNLLCFTLWWIGIIILLYSTVFQLSKRRWKAGILTSVMVIMSILVYLIIFTFSMNPKLVSVFAFSAVTEI